MSRQLRWFHLESEKLPRKAKSKPRKNELREGRTGNVGLQLTFHSRKYKQAENSDPSAIGRVST